jgi:hypothetical protein
LKTFYKYKEWILFIVAILSLIVASYSIKITQDIAYNSGAYNKPIIETRIGNMILNNSNHITIASSPRLPNELSISTLSFYLTNIGQKNLDNFFVTFKYPEMSPRKIFENLDFYMEGIFDKSEYNRKFVKIGNDYFVSYKFNSINPGSSIKIAEPILIEETKINDTVKVKDKNGIPFSISYKLDYEIVFGISLSAKNTPSEDYKISYSIINTTSKEDFINKLYKQFYKTNLKIREEENYFTYIFKLLFFNKDIEEVVIYPNLEKIKYKQYVMNFDEKPNVKTVKYKKYIWSLVLYNKTEERNE